MQTQDATDFSLFLQRTHEIEQLGKLVPKIESTEELRKHVAEMAEARKVGTQGISAMARKPA